MQFGQIQDTLHNVLYLKRTLKPSRKIHLNYFWINFGAGELILSLKSAPPLCAAIDKNDGCIDSVPLHEHSLYVAHKMWIRIWFKSHFYQKSPSPPTLILFRHKEHLYLLKLPCQHKERIEKKHVIGELDRGISR